MSGIELAGRGRRLDAMAEKAREAWSEAGNAGAPRLLALASSSDPEQVDLLADAVEL